MQRNNIIVAFAFGLAVGLLLWNISLATSSEYVQADTSGSASGIIAVTGAINNNTDGLWVIDAGRGSDSPAVALYKPVSNGNGMALVAARRIKYDLDLVAYQDFSKLKVGDVRKETHNQIHRFHNMDGDK